jgi:hypothetical protein
MRVSCWASAVAVPGEPGTAHLLFLLSLISLFFPSKEVLTMTSRIDMADKKI